MKGVKSEAVDEERIGQWFKKLHIQIMIFDDLDGVLRQNFMGNLVFTCPFHLYPFIIKREQKV